MERDDDKIDEDLATIQKTIKIAADRVAHHIKAEEIYSVPLRMPDYVRKLLQDTRKRSRGKQGLNTW